MKEEPSQTRLLHRSWSREQRCRMAAGYSVFWKQVPSNGFAVWSEIVHLYVSTQQGAISQSL